MAGFCSQCGRPLADGEVCTCTQQAAQSQQFNPAAQQGFQQASQNQQFNAADQQNYQQAAPNQQNYQQAAPNQQNYQQGTYQQQGAGQPGYQQADPNAQQQFGANGQPGYQQFDANGQPIYGTPVQPQQPSQASIIFKGFGKDLLASLKNPIKAVKEISVTEKKSFGLLAVALNAIVIMFVEFILFAWLQSTINSAIGSFSSYYSVSLPTVQVIFSSLIALAAVFFAQTGLLLACTKMLGGQSAKEGFGHMLTITGEKAFYDAMVLVIVAIFFMLSPIFGVILFALGNTFVNFIYIVSYCESVAIEGYRKVLALLITEVGKMIVSAIIGFIAFSSVLTTLMQYASYVFDIF